MLKQETRAKFKRGVNLTPYTTVKMGEKGTVVDYETDDLGVLFADIKLDEHHPGLNRWQNVAHITGPELENVQFSKQWVFPRANVSKAAILAFGIMAMVLGMTFTEAVEADKVGSALFELPLCGSYSCLQQHATHHPEGHNKGRVDGYYDSTKGVA